MLDTSLFPIIRLGNIRGSNAVGFCAVTHLPTHSKTYINLLKAGSNHGVLPKLRFENTLPTSNDILSVHWFGLLSSLESIPNKTTAGRCDILGLLMAQCTLVKKGTLLSG